jgi:dipeptide transport system permease protein
MSTEAEPAIRSAVFQLDAEAGGIDHSLKLKPTIGTGEPLSLAAAMITCIGCCAIFAAWIAPHDPLEQNLLSILVPPVWADGGDLSFPLGTDSLGRCVLSRLIYGARTAMLVAFFASLGAMTVGSVLAHIAGYFGGAVDWLIGRLVDVWMSFPPVVLSLILMVGLGVGLDKVILAIILVDWTRFCRVLRSEVLVVTRHDYVSAARLLGFSHWQAIVREVLPCSSWRPPISW